MWAIFVYLSSQAQAAMHLIIEAVTAIWNRWILLVVAMQCECLYVSMSVVGRLVSCCSRNMTKRRRSEGWEEQEGEMEMVVLSESRFISWWDWLRDGRESRRSVLIVMLCYLGLCLVKAVVTVTSGICVFGGEGMKEYALSISDGLLLCVSWSRSFWRVGWLWGGIPRQCLCRWN